VNRRRAEDRLPETLILIVVAWAILAGVLYAVVP
jgi:hypothetical protein